MLEPDLLADRMLLIDLKKKNFVNKIITTLHRCVFLQSQLVTNDQKQHITSVKTSCAHRIYVQRCFSNILMARFPQELQICPKIIDLRMQLAIKQPCEIVTLILSCQEGFNKKI